MNTNRDGHRIIRKAFLPLFSFNVVAQFFPILFLPLFAHIFAPAEIGQITLFNSISLILAEIGSLKYDQAIIVAKNQKEAVGLFALSMVMTLGIALGVGALFLSAHFLFGLRVDLELFDNTLITVLFFMISVVLNQLNKSLFLLFNRFTKIRNMSLLTALPVIVYNGGAVLIGYLYLPTFEVLVFVKLFSFIAIFMMFAIRMKMTISKLRSIFKTDYRSLLRTFVNYPKYILPGKLMNMLTLKSVDFVIAGFFGNGVLGQFSIARRFVMVPETTVSKSISDIFRRQGFDSNGQIIETRLRELFRKYIIILLFSGLAIFSIAFLIVPYAVDFLLDEKWTDVVWISRYLLIGYFFSFIISPVTSIFRSMNKEKRETIFQVFFISLLAIFSITTYLQGYNFETFVGLLSAHRALSFVFAFVLIIYIFKRLK